MSDSHNTEPAQIDKDKAIAYLLAKSKKLEQILLQIDRDVADAAKKYLTEWKPSFEGEKLTFAQFLALLQGEVTKTLRFEWVNSKESPLRKSMEETLIREFEERVASDSLGNKLSVLIHVVREVTITGDGGMKRVPVYRATCLERQLYVESGDIDDVIQKWLTKVRTKMVRGPITRFLISNDKQLEKMFRKGVLLTEAKIENFVVTIHGYPDKVFENFGVK